MAQSTPAVTAATTPALRCTSHRVVVTKANYEMLLAAVPSTAVGLIRHNRMLRIEVRANGEGAVCAAEIQDGSNDLEDVDGGCVLEPVRAVRMVKDLTSFEGSRHLSIMATNAMWPADGDEPAAPRERIPVTVSNDQFLLTKLEEFIAGSEFRCTTERFAEEHAHKFKPLTAEDEYPLHYQTLHVQFEATLESALEGFLAEHNASVADLVQLVTRYKQRGDSLECIDVLLASTDFAAFLELMLDYKFALVAEREVTPGSVLAVHDATSPQRR